MKVEHPLTIQERSASIEELVKSLNDSIAFALFISPDIYHQLNSRAYSLFKRLGIEYNSDDLKVFEKYHEAIWKIRNNIENDKSLNYNVNGSIQMACFRLANYFFLLSNFVNILDNATKAKDDDNGIIDREGEQK